MTNRVSISPVLNETQYFDEDGFPLNGGLIFQYEAGSFSTLQTTYTTVSGNIANQNPIVLDSSGRSTQSLWLTNGSSYNLVLTKPDGTTVLNQYDDINGVVGATSTGVIGSVIWNVYDLIPIYVSGTQFLLEGVDASEEFAIGNRVRTTFTDSSNAFSVVSGVNYAAGNTYVNIINDSLPFSGAAQAVAWSALVTNGITVDAGAVSYTTGLNYAGRNTVGQALQAQNGSIIGTNAVVAEQQLVHTTSGSGSAYSISPNPASLSYVATQKWTVKFHTGSVGTPTFNVNGIGAYPLYQPDYAGNLIIPLVSAGMVSDVAWNGSQFVLLDQLPPPPPSASASPDTVYMDLSMAVNETFYLPANCIGIHIYSDIAGYNGRGGVTGVRIYDSSNNLLGTVRVSGTNTNNGPDGKSGLADAAGGYVPMSRNASYIQTALISGDPVFYSFKLQAYTVFN